MPGFMLGINKWTRKRKEIREISVAYKLQTTESVGGIMSDVYKHFVVWLGALIVFVIIRLIITWVSKKD
jgi:hypothetical protein